MTATTIMIDMTDLDSVAAAIKAGITTIGQVADYLDVELVEGCLVLDGSPVVADDGNAPIEYDADTDPADAAQEYVDEGEWGESTTWIHVSTWRVGLDADGDESRVGREHHTITLDPEEPDCLDGAEHVWESPLSLVGGIKENPGCWGHGGGVTQKSACVRCGCGRLYDSWATDPRNGTSGHDSTSYEEGEYADEVATMHLTAAVDHLTAEESDGGYIYSDMGGLDYRADRDQMTEYGRALVCDETADLPGEVVEADEDE